jgi:malate dehydrogenase (oxaloacetate-decarboxylating)
MSISEDSLKLHKEKKGKLEIISKIKLDTKENFSLAYTPGVAEPCKKILEDKENAYKYTIKSNTIAIISNGTAVLGLGNIGATASIPVMEGKAAIFKELAGINAFPICIDSQDTQKNIETIKLISPIFGGINLEDYKAPECFEIEQALQNLGIPVMHDDQHGTAIVVLAGLINSLKLANKPLTSSKIIIAGAGAAGIGITKLLLEYQIPPENILLCDTKGIIYQNREDLQNNPSKLEISNLTNRNIIKGNLEQALENADVFIGVSKKDTLTPELIQIMNPKPIIFAMANPEPEIMPNEAKKAGAFIIATGRSDFPNQVNNALVFPGIFKGALEIRAKTLTTKMKISVAEAIAKYTKNLNSENILPEITDKKLPEIVAEAIKKAYVNEN